MKENIQHIAILGAGESGVGAAILAQKQGLDVFVSDRGTIKDHFKKELVDLAIPYESGHHSEDKILKADLIIKSPGIPDHVPLIKKAKENGIAVISEIEFASWYSDSKIIAITGSNGKTTTTLLIHHMLKKAGLDVGLGGNVGHSYARQVAKEKKAYYVLELSSFQLDGIEKFRPHIAVLLNITPDHLDRYENSMQKYASSKFRITLNQQKGDVLIYNYDDPLISEGVTKLKTRVKTYPFALEPIEGEGAYLDEKQEQIIINIKDQFNMSIHDLALKGKHNAQNSMAAGITGKVLEIRKENIRESLSDFQNVEHRLEFVAKVCGIEFINDSKATNVNATWYALESVENKTVWIVGGQDKGNDYSVLDELVKEKVKAIICLGKDNSKIIEHYEGMVDQILEADSAMQAVAYGYKLAQKDETVMLSPACASFDLFDDYEDRGNQFKQAVRAL